MASATPITVRKEIFELISKGVSLSEISKQLNLSYAAVRSLNRRFRTMGEAGLSPSYALCGSSPKLFEDGVYTSCIAYRNQRDWGAMRILVELRRDYPNVDLPSERTINRWLEGEKIKRTQRAT